MRSALVLILAILVSAFLAGLLALSSRLDRGGPPAEARMVQVRGEFIRSMPPESEFNLSDFGPRDRLPGIADPALLLPRSARLPYPEIAALYRYAEGCDERDHLDAKNPEIRKAFRFHAFLCEKASAPGPDFFRTAPYTHPSGASYVALARKSGRAEFASAEWIRANSRYAHLLERGGFPAEVLTPSERIAATLTPSAMRAVLDEGGTVVAEPFVLFRTEGREFTGKYSLYPLAKYRDALSRAGATLATTDDASAFSATETPVSISTPSAQPAPRNVRRSS